ncbi:MAG: hypothetical protein Q7T16_01145 [Candidatus Burarchaeum sp.]|nr:hypothetical protein [Candidatus Burarchaeum sp.]MDO8339242.1 hypothetical protein [Candidatus Burarchaeum sp.]
MASERLALILVVLLALGSLAYAASLVSSVHTYISDYADKTPFNRVYNTSADKYDNMSYVTYTSSGRNYSPFALPLKGNYWGGNMITYWGPDRYAVNKMVLGNNTSTDQYAGIKYTEEIRVWAAPYTYYDSVLKKVVAKHPYLAYDMEFSDKFGNPYIPVCTAKNASDNWATCSAPDNSGNHRIPVVFMGENWVLNEVDISESQTGIPADGINFTAGGAVTLAKEISFSTLHVNQTIPVGQYVLKFVDVTVPTENLPFGAAVIEIYDANGQKVYDTRIAAYNRMLWTAPNGYLVIARIYHTHYSESEPDSRWAQIAIQSAYVELRDDERLRFTFADPAMGTFYVPFWHAKLIWKNRGDDSTGVNATLPDSLSRIVIHNAEDIYIPGTKLQELGGMTGTPNASNTIQILPGYAKLNFSFYQLQPAANGNLLVQSTDWMDQKVYNSSTCTGNWTMAINVSALIFMAQNGGRFATQENGTYSDLIAFVGPGRMLFPGYWFMMRGKTPSGSTCYYLAPKNNTPGFLYDPGDGWQRITLNISSITYNGTHSVYQFKIEIPENAGNSQMAKYALYYNRTIRYAGPIESRFILNHTTYTQVTYGMNPEQTYLVNAGHISDRGTIMSFVSPYSTIFNERAAPAKAMYVLWK